MARGAQLSINPGAMVHNLRVARAYAGSARIVAPIKADAYGHGLLLAAAALRGADAFAVACLEEALPLREAGYAHPILLLEGVFDGAELLQACRYRLDMVIHADWQIRLLERERLPRPVNVWIKVDTGMHRLGFAPDQVVDAFHRLARCRNVASHIRLMTHFACADNRDDATTLRQLAAFDAATADLDGEHSLANSAALLGWPQTHRQWVRPGIMLYGASPFVDQRDAPRLRPAMTLSSRLIAIRRVAAGEAVGYGRSWVASEPSQVGTVALGYGDGYPRHAPSGTPVLVNGIRTQLIGRVSMDMLTVDLGPLGDHVEVGDAVVLWGDGLPAEEVAGHVGTIAYELFCGVGARVPRVTMPAPSTSAPGG